MGPGVGVAIRSRSGGGGGSGCGGGGGSTVRQQQHYTSRLFAILACALQLHETHVLHLVAAMETSTSLHTSHDPLERRGGAAESDLRAGTTTAETTGTAESATASKAGLAESLSGLSFLNGGQVKATDRFERLTQCNGFAEAYTTWNSGSVRDYLYETTTGNATVPPIGMRSAMPLGGLGTGTFELRADGSFADWQVENQGPALATDAIQNSKLPLLEGALLGLKIGDFATTLRTHPPRGSGLPAAEALNYSGAYPFARLGLHDSRLRDKLSASVFAYSAAKVHDANASALPAVAFTLVLENRGPAALNASFLLTLPLASTLYTSRHSSTGVRNRAMAPLANDTSVIKVLGNVTAAACLAACGTTPNCTYWDVDLKGSPGVPAVPAVPPQVRPDYDCPDPNLGPGDTRKPFKTIVECYDYCNATKGCGGFVWDQIASEISGQCKGAKPGEWCCIPKGKHMHTFVPKKGDTMVSYGTPGVPAVLPMPGPGCVLHSGAPAVQQFHTKGSSSKYADAWSVPLVNNLTSWL